MASRLTLTFPTPGRGRLLKFTPLTSSPRELRSVPALGSLTVTALTVALIPGVGALGEAYSNVRVHRPAFWLGKFLAREWTHARSPPPGV